MKTTRRSATLLLAIFPIVLFAQQLEKAQQNSAIEKSIVKSNLPSDTLKKNHFAFEERPNQTIISTKDANPKAQYQNGTSYIIPQSVPKPSSEDIKMYRTELSIRTIRNELTRIENGTQTTNSPMARNERMIQYYALREFGKEQYSTLITTTNQPPTSNSIANRLLELDYLIKQIEQHITQEEQRVEMQIRHQQEFERQRRSNLENQKLK